MEKEKESPQYYDGKRLLSMKDINGRDPEIFIVTTNRTAGKTYWFSKLLVNRFIRKHKKFMLLYRWRNELVDVAEKFFKDISYDFPDYTMTGAPRMDGAYYSLVLNDEECGYAVALNASDAVKKTSHMFSDVDSMFFDEFQLESDKYVPGEINKFLSVHTSVARGRGEQVRYVPVYMAANTTSLINPYYVEMGISNRLHSDTKFLRGDGYVLEQGYVDTAARAQLDSGVSRAFKNSTYVAYANQNVYLHDSLSFIEHPTGRSIYLATIRYNGKDYAIREFAQQGYIYCDDHPDKTFPTKIAITTADHNINYVMLKRNDFFIRNLRYFFEKGAFRFKDLSCKEAVLKTICY